MKFTHLILLLLVLWSISGCATLSQDTRAWPPGKQPDSTTAGPIEAATSEVGISPVPSDHLPREATAPISSLPANAVTLSASDRVELYNHFIEAALLEQSGKYDEASNAYLDALEKIKPSPFLGASAAQSLLNSGMVDEAIKIAQQTIESASDHLEGYEVLAKAYLARRDYDQAIQQYQRMLALEPNSIETMTDLGNLYLSTHRYEEAIGIFHKIADLVPYQAFVYRLQIAFLLFQMQRYNEALKEYQILARMEPESYEIHLQMGTLYQVMGKVDEAIEEYLTALESIYSPQNEILVRQNLGELYQSRGSYTEAIHQFSRVKELDPDNLKARMILAYLYMEENQYPQALDEVVSLIQTHPDDFSLHRLRFDILVKLQREAEAYQSFLQAFEQAIRYQNQTNINAFLWDLLQDDSLEKINSFQQTHYLEELLKQASAQSGHVTRLRFAITKFDAVHHRKEALQKDLLSIVSALEEALSRKDQGILDILCFELLRWIRVRTEMKNTGMAFEVVKTLENGLPLFPQSALLCQALGALSLDLMDFSRAETAFNQALALSEPDSSSYKEILFQLAWTYDRMDRLADVERLMQEAMQKYPDDSEAYNYLGYTYADRNIHLDQALTLVEKALKLEPDDSNIIDSLGWVYFRLGRLDEAIRKLEQALELDHTHPVIHEHLGDAYRQKGDQQKALAHWKESLKVGPQFPYEFTPDIQARIEKKIHKTEGTGNP